MSKKRPYTKYIVVHCSATPPDMDIGRKEIDLWHRQRKFLKVGYHFIIRRDGEVEKGRELEEYGAHAKGFNDVSVSICMVGGVKKNKTPEDNFTEEQYKSLGLLVDQMKSFYPKAKVLGHRDLPGVKKDCPSFDVKSWWHKARPQIKALFENTSCN